MPPFFDGRVTKLALSKKIQLDTAITVRFGVQRQDAALVSSRRQRLAWAAAALTGQSPTRNPAIFVNQPLGALMPASTKQQPAVLKRRARADPLLSLALILAGLPAIWVIRVAAEFAAARQPTWAPALSLLPTICLLALGLCALPAAKQLWKTASAVRQRSQALRQLPGPSYGWLGVLLELRNMNVHRCSYSFAASTALSCAPCAAHR